eukprot:GHVN01018845.1.p1 GENE.GHVN01018845.1~~GHVN01018845.1.p1  ORF type:complete len:190 (-),score=8.53 GHVN01018845.1:30-599(-)
MLTTFGDTSAAVTHANALHALRGKFSSISEVACERLKPEQSPMPEYLIADVSVVGPLTGDHGIWSQPAVGTQSVYVLVSFQAVDEELRSSSMKLWSMASVFRSFLSTCHWTQGFLKIYYKQSVCQKLSHDLQFLFEVNEWFLHFKTLIWRFSPPPKQRQGFFGVWRGLEDIVWMVKAVKAGICVKGWLR